MPTIELSQLTVQFDQGFTLRNVDWKIAHDQHWAIVGANGSGKSALTAILVGDGDVISGEINQLPSRVAIASFISTANHGS